MLGAFLVLNLSFLIPNSPAVDVDGVAARVGSDSILRSDVIEELRRGGPQNARSYSETLNWLIERKLILRAAAESKMTMQEWVVENRVREIVNRAFGGDRNKLIESLGQQKLSYPEWYAKVKEDLIVGAMRWNVVDKNTAASPAALRKEFEANRNRYVKGRKVTVVILSLPPTEAAKRGEIEKSLKEKKLEDLGGVRYADIDPRAQFESRLAQEVEAAEVGTVGKWIDIGGWSFLLRKDADAPGKVPTFEEAYEAVEAEVKEQEARRLYRAWLERLKAETYIKIY